MENTRAHSHKSYRVKSKFPVILTKKSNTGQLLEKVILKDQSSTLTSTPEPSLIVQLKKIHRRPLNSSSPSPKPDTFNEQTNEALSNLIKNNAITFMSPHEFINQIHNDSMTQSPSSKFKLDNSSPLLANKLLWLQGFYQFNPIPKRQNNKSNRSDWLSDPQAHPHQLRQQTAALFGQCQVTRAQLEQGPGHAQALQACDHLQQAAQVLPAQAGGADARDEQLLLPHVSNNVNSH